METFNGLPLLKIALDENRDDHGVDKISLVDFPAIEEDFLRFRKQGKSDDVQMNFVETDSEQMKLAGPFLIPNKPILRVNEDTGQEFYVMFPEDVVREIAERFNANLYGNRFNEQHDEDQDLNDVFVSENWIIDDSVHDKSQKFGFEFPVGTWFGIVKVNDRDLWENKIKTGELRGFSVELLGNLKFSIESSIVEQKFIEKMDGLGEVLPSNARLISVDDIDENESEFDIEKRLNELDQEFELSEDQEKIQFRIVANPESNSSLDRLKVGNDGVAVGQWIVRYKYDGPRDSKNRTFCSRVLAYQSRTEKLFRKEDIDRMTIVGENREFGTYNIFQYKGSFGCRHKWTRQIFFIDFEDDETRRVGNVPAVTSSINDSDARKVNKKPQRSRNNFSNIDTMKQIQFKFGASLSALLNGAVDSQSESEGVDRSEIVKQMSESADVDESTVNAILSGEIECPSMDVLMSIVSVLNDVTEDQVNQALEQDGCVSEENEEMNSDETNENLDEHTGGDEMNPDFEEFKTMTMNKIAELESKIEQIMSMMNGSDESSGEQFSSVDLTANIEDAVKKFMSENRPATVLESESDNDKKEDDKIGNVTVTLARMKGKNKKQ